MITAVLMMGASVVSFVRFIMMESWGHIPPTRREPRKLYPLRECGVVAQGDSFCRTLVVLARGVAAPPSERSPLLARRGGRDIKKYCEASLAGADGVVDQENRSLLFHGA